MMLAVTSEWNKFTVMSISSPLVPCDLHALLSFPPSARLLFAWDMPEGVDVKNCMGIIRDLETACSSWL